MLFVEIGKRYERLLLFTAPITLATIFLLLVAFAASQQQERVDANCLRIAAKQLKAAMPKLLKSWEAGQPVTKNWAHGPQYRYEIAIALIGTDYLGVCDDAVDKKLDELDEMPPSKIVEGLEEGAKAIPLALRGKALSVYGIELPADTTVDLLGTKIRVDLMTVANILLVVLLPVLLMWLGSLYNTRSREALLIARAPTLAEVFPHVINMFPYGTVDSPKKRSALAPLIRPAACLLSSVIRVVLLCVFVLPPVTSYLASLVLMSLQIEFFWPFAVAGLIVLSFAATNLMAEFGLPHSSRVFPPVDVAD